MSHLNPAFLILLVESLIWSYYQPQNRFKMHLFNSELSPNSPFEQPFCTVSSSWEISSLLYSFLHTDMINLKDIVPRGCLFFLNRTNGYFPAVPPSSFEGCAHSRACAKSILGYVLTEGRRICSNAGIMT